MIPAEILGALLLALPPIVLGWLALRRQPRPIRFFLVALVLIGVGYLVATGTAAEVARMVAPTLVARGA